MSPLSNTLAPTLTLKAEPIPGLKLVSIKRFGDARGFFEESFKVADLDSLGIQERFIQDNMSWSQPGVVRGLHIQRRFIQGKWIRCLRGRIFDVAVDVRLHSPTYGKWFGVELSESEATALYVPPGFLHGFSVPGPDHALVMYKVTDRYHAESEAGVHPLDPTLGIDWKGASGGSWTLSDKDQKLPYFRDFGAVDLGS